MTRTAGPESCPTYEKKMSAGRVPPSSRAVGAYMYRNNPYPIP